VYLVSATPPKPLIGFLWNFTHLSYTTCRCAWRNMVAVQNLEGEIIQHFMKLYTVVVHNLQMCMKDYRCCLKFRRGDNLTYKKGGCVPCKRNSS
jgi:hypothetical protein